MSNPGGDGPDGSSLKPVSSLLARFEHMNSPDTSSPPPSRPISPGPKPDKLKDFKSTGAQDGKSPPVVAAKPPPKPVAPKPLAFKDRPKSVLTSSEADQAPSSSTKPAEPSRILQPIKAHAPPPAVMVQPPQSPPKSKTLPAILTNNSALRPIQDGAGTPSTASGTSPITASPKPFKIPSRPLTPTSALPGTRSPRLTPSRPPSPPPPRRSGELKREPKIPPPPPTPRGQKAQKAANALEPQEASAGKGSISAEASPFNSAPASPPPEEEDIPPQLPARPPAQPPQETSAQKSVGGFGPPPVHHSIAHKRPDRDFVNGSASTVGRLAEQSRPAPRSRSQEHGARAATDTAPPQPPRPQPPKSNTGLTSTAMAAPQKRVISNPSTQSLPMATPKTHERSQTVDTSAPAPHIPASTRSMPTAVPSATVQISAFPDVSNTNRRPPFIKGGVHELATKYEPRVFDVCGEFVCTSGQLTRVHSLLDGEVVMSLQHTEGVKATSVAFRPAATPEQEATKVWIGTNLGEIMEVDVASHGITPGKGNVHGRAEVIRMYRHSSELWTMDEGGGLLIWGPDEDGVPNISGLPTQSYKLPRNHTFSLVVGDQLWHATGKEVRVFAPTLDGRTQFQVLIRPIVAEGAGEVTAGTLTRSQPGKVFLGHNDGKISIFSATDYSCLSVLSISTFKITTLAGVGPYMWAGFNSGKICVYSMDSSPWVAMKEWQAHENPVIKMKLDTSSAYTLDRMQVVSLGSDNRARIWDGLLEDDWIEDELKSKDVKYAQFDEISAMVFTWNAGASTPYSLRSEQDAKFFPELLRYSGSPDILVFGFQELVDLEDKAATAKRFLKSSKKKEGSDQEKMSHQYRNWRDYLIKTLDNAMPQNTLYQLLKTAPMVGLFTCVFVKADLMDRITNVSAAEVKRGLGGLHGNKGAVAVRFLVDDTSLCFVNCHLAAGQTQANSRHNDAAAILESSIFPPERNPDTRLDKFTAGGDGTMIVDHELCVLNGDLNYRIDTMSRDTVVTAVKQNNLAKLLDRDQLLVARRRNPGFRLRVFEEMPITFAPTYKYDVGTDTYDTSEKRRSPAWCDRLLFRGRGRLQQLDYSRHEIRTSDHRPVTGRYRLWVKRIDPKGRGDAFAETRRSFEALKVKELAAERQHYLVNTCGFDEATSKKMAKAKAGR